MCPALLLTSPPTFLPRHGPLANFRFNCEEPASNFYEQQAKNQQELASIYQNLPMRIVSLVTIKEHKAELILYI